MNDDLLKKEATTDSRSETFSSIMKVRGEKRERERQRRDRGGRSGEEEEKRGREKERGEGKR